MTGALLATGFSLHLPDAPVLATLSAELSEPPGDWTLAEAAPADRAATVLGRKGLLYKEPATRLALCAVHRAFGLPAGQRPGWPLDPSTAVVVASNLGNVETVAKVSRLIRAEGGGAVSVLDAPNVSSNVIASSVALWFGLGGPNLMVCSGSAAGWDGLALAGLLLRAGRADRVVLVGVEPADEVTAVLHQANPVGAPPRAGAACLILHDYQPDRPVAAGQAVIEPVGSAAADAGRWPRQPGLVIGSAGFDPARWWGDYAGAGGVVALALAAQLAGADRHPLVGVRGPAEHGYRAALVSPAKPAGGSHD